jgi:hypothetical protein
LIPVDDRVDFFQLLDEGHSEMHPVVGKEVEGLELFDHEFSDLVPVAMSVVGGQETRLVVKGVPIWW